MAQPTDKKIKALIAEAVTAGLQAGMVTASSAAKDAFKETERRLYALPILERKLAEDKENLEEMKTFGPRERSKSIVRFQRTGYRVAPEEMLEAIVRDLEASIATSEHEIATVRRAMESFSEDPYYMTVTKKYLERYDDEDIAADMECSATQVWKQRSRIVKDIAIMLYGVGAV